MVVLHDLEQQQPRKNRKKPLCLNSKLVQKLLGVCFFSFFGSFAQLPRLFRNNKTNKRRKTTKININKTKREKKNIFGKQTDMYSVEKNVFFRFFVLGYQIPLIGKVWLKVCSHQTSHGCVNFVQWTRKCRDKLNLVQRSNKRQYINGTCSKKGRKVCKKHCIIISVKNASGCLFLRAFFEGGYPIYIYIYIHRYFFI